MCLADKAEHFGVSRLAVDYYLAFFVGALFPFLFYALLQSEHNGACGINQLQIVLLGNGIGFGWLAMGAKQHLGIVQLAILLVVYCYQSQSFEPFTFYVVVHNVAQTV